MPLDSSAEHLDEALNALSAAGYVRGLRVLQGCRLGPQKQRDDQGQSPGTNSMTMPPLGGGMEWRTGAPRMIRANPPHICRGRARIPPLLAPLVSGAIGAVPAALPAVMASLSSGREFPHVEGSNALLFFLR